MILPGQTGKCGLSHTFEPPLLLLFSTGFPGMTDVMSLVVDRKWELLFMAISLLPHTHTLEQRLKGRETKRERA